MGSPSSPERDRALARTHRERFRRPAAIGDELAGFRHSPEYAAMRRFARVHSVLLEVLPPHAQGKVRAISLANGVCSLEAVDGVICAELRSSWGRRILAALAAGGTGATRLAWRVARRS